MFNREEILNFTPINHLLRPDYLGVGTTGVESKEKLEKNEEKALRRWRGKGVESGRKQEKVRKYIKKMNK